MEKTGNGRKRFTSEQKVSLLRRHLLEKETVSSLCEEAGIAPTQFYRWQKELFEKGCLALEPQMGRKRNQSVLEERIGRLEDKLRRKNEVLSELMEEHVALKKSFGEL